jgi:MFS family permease
VSTAQGRGESARIPTRVPRAIVGAILLGTLLNPLNSSMIAVALVRLRDDFGVTLATVSWLVSAFYIAAAVGQPLMGRLADLLGPRRVFCAGWVLVALTGALAPLTPTFGWLVAARVVQALGTSAAFPAGLALIRRSTPDPSAPPPAAALGALAIGGSVSAALGPVLGGVLVAVAGWEAIFLVNVVLAAIGLPLALRVLPRDPPVAAGEGGPRAAGALVDWTGIVLFSGALAAGLGFVLSLEGSPRWVLVPVALVLGALLAVRERRARTPIIDLDVATDRRVAAVLAQYAAVNVVFYVVFFGLPQWLEEVRGFAPGEAGLLLLPIAGLGVVATPFASRLVSRRGPRLPLLIGAVALTAGAALILLLDGGTPVVGILLVGAVLGVPNGFNNLGLQAALYERTPPEHTGAAGGLFQTFRYLGAILATALIGAFFGERATTAGLHELALVAVAIGALLVLASARRARVTSPAPDGAAPRRR